MFRTRRQQPTNYRLQRRQIAEAIQTDTKIRYSDHGGPNFERWFVFPSHLVLRSEDRDDLARFLRALDVVHYNTGFEGDCLRVVLKYRQPMDNFHSAKIKQVITEFFPREELAFEKSVKQ